jgi:hypothetical protein
MSDKYRQTQPNIYEVYNASDEEIEKIKQKIRSDMPKVPLGFEPAIGIINHIDDREEFLKDYAALMARNENIFIKMLRRLGNWLRKYQT